MVEDSSAGICWRWISWKWIRRCILHTINKTTKMTRNSNVDISTMHAGSDDQRTCFVFWANLSSDCFKAFPAVLREESAAAAFCLAADKALLDAAALVLAEASCASASLRASLATPAHGRGGEERRG